MADGYYVRAAYLFWLDQTLEYAPPGAGELLADDVDGLRVVACARERYLRELRAVSEVFEVERARQPMLRALRKTVRSRGKLMPALSLTIEYNGSGVVTGIQQIGAEGEKAMNKLSRRPASRSTSSF
jgi:hypothetical protein